jgi:FAD/FMN-containing dehydrogenase/Fe-S oxidoreductase
MNLEQTLRNDMKGDVLFDQFSRGRYATDASIYQIMPLGVVIPRSIDEAKRAIMHGRDAGVTVMPRGGGTSQCGQTVNESLVLDCSKYLNKIISLDVENRICVVEPGIVLDDLNRQLKKHGLWFPVDISTASRATIGGMAANNSCGGRSLRYGTMRDNTLEIEAMTADGVTQSYGMAHNSYASALKIIGKREAGEIAARFPSVQRRVGGYNLDALTPSSPNFAHILTGSEGTLAFTTAVTLKLSPLLGAKVFGLCHFASFYEAMNAAQYLVTLKPIAVELIDATMIELARAIPMFRPTVEAVIKGAPAAVLVVEFAEESDLENHAQLKLLDDLVQTLKGTLVQVTDPALQNAVTDMRTSGLNIMMSMKEAGKPVSFIEDCAVPLEHLADYTSRLTEIFEAHGTKGTWYAHASVGCLHVRPVLNMKLDKDVKTMRSIAELAFAEVRRYKGSHSGEHGDGIVRSEFHEVMFGSRLVKAFEEVKTTFDPTGLFNPGKITNAPKMDDRRLFRYNENYKPIDFTPVLTWEYPGQMLGGVEMCNNNGTCRKLEGGAMCPSYRVTRDEAHVTRGRANTLRLALTGQLGKDALTSDAMHESLKLCVSCKSCKNECPTSVDMAKMKLEVTAARTRKYGLSLHEKLVAYLPVYAPFASFFAPLVNRFSFLARFADFAPARSLPKWRRDAFRESGVRGTGKEVVLFADSFNANFEREHLDNAIKILVAGGYQVHLHGKEKLCCGRTYLSTGLIDEARKTQTHLVETLYPYVEKGIKIIGLEPSCLFTLKDEMPSLLKTDEAKAVGNAAMLLEQFLVSEKVQLPLKPLDKPVMLHGHCHQKAYGAMSAVQAAIKLIPEVQVSLIESSCCGMAGSFGYHKDTFDMSNHMAELSLLPAIRKVENAYIVADGTSCRHQIKDGAQREALHVADILAMALK